MSSCRLQNSLTTLPARINIPSKPQPCCSTSPSSLSNNSRVFCCGYSFRNQVKKMEEGHHDLSKVTVAGDPQLLQNKVNAVYLAGPAKLQAVTEF
ncbi:hypothetical protein BDE02_08G012200 [Populus trichocarpa]|nr:hypothetical protein BDE02_08G012200 [Populus trichocarpa]